MHLVEVLIAASVLAAVCVSLPAAFAGSVRANMAAAEATWTAVLAAQKVEELRSEPFSAPGFLDSSDFLDAAGRPVEGPWSTPAFHRRWRIEPLASAPDETIVITVLVAPYRRFALDEDDAAATGGTRLVTLRTRKAT